MCHLRGGSFIPSRELSCAREHSRMRCVASREDRSFSQGRIPSGELSLAWEHFRSRCVASRRFIPSLKGDFIRLGAFPLRCIASRKDHSFPQGSFLEQGVSLWGRIVRSLRAAFSCSRVFPRELCLSGKNHSFPHGSFSTLKRIPARGVLPRGMIIHSFMGAFPCDVPHLGGGSFIPSVEQSLKEAFSCRGAFLQEVLHLGGGSFIPSWEFSRARCVTSGED